MASEDSLQNLGERTLPLLPLSGRIQRIRLLDDARQPLRGMVLLGLEGENNLLEDREMLLLCGIHHVLFDEGKNLFPQASATGDGEDQNLGIPRLGVDPPRAEDFPRHLQKPSPAFMLVDVEFGIHVDAELCCGMFLDGYGEASLALDESGQEPPSGLGFGEPFLLIGPTQAFVTSSVGWDTRAVPAYSRILQRPSQGPASLLLPL